MKIKQEILQQIKNGLIVSIQALKDENKTINPL